MDLSFRSTGDDGEADHPATGQPGPDPREIHDPLSLIREAMITGWMADLDRPHIAICTDLGLGTRSYVGPFPDALRAITAADAEAASMREGGIRGQVEVTLLLPPTTHDVTDPTP